MLCLDERRFILHRTRLLAKKRQRQAGRVLNSMTRIVEEISSSDDDGDDVNTVGVEWRLGNTDSAHGELPPLRCKCRSPKPPRRQSLAKTPGSLARGRTSMDVCSGPFALIFLHCVCRLH